MKNGRSDLCWFCLCILSWNWSKKKDISRNALGEISSWQALESGFSLPIFTLNYIVVLSLHHCSFFFRVEIPWRSLRHFFDKIFIFRAEASEPSQNRLQLELLSVKLNFSCFFHPRSDKKLFFYLSYLKRTLVSLSDK